jgi:hypothetical protein
MNNKKIKFRELDSKRKHKDTLTQIIEASISTDDIFNNEAKNKQSYTEELLTHYWIQVKEYLKNKGFEDTNGLFCVCNGEVVCWNKKTRVSIKNAMPLWAAIQKRDAFLG